MATEVEIYNLAARAIGAGEVASVDDPGTVASNIRAVFDVTLDAMLSSNRWTFATVKRQLARLTASPLNDFTYAFQLPAGTLKVWRVYPNTDYEKVGAKLFSNQTEIEADLTVRPGIGDLPDDFVRALYFELAGSVAIPVTQNPDIALTMERKALQQWRMARNNDAQQDPPQPVVDSPFTDVRNL